MTRILLAVAVAAVALLAGCAMKPAEPSMRTDWRTGTDHSPYRSIPAAIQCDDCRYEQ